MGLKSKEAGNPDNCPDDFRRTLEPAETTREIYDRRCVPQAVDRHIQMRLPLFVPAYNQGNFPRLAVTIQY